MDKVKSFNIQKFDGSNFQLWKYQMEIIFRAEKLHEIVSGIKIRPAEEDAQNTWDELNARTMLLISTAMEFDQLQTIMTCATAKDMWNRLKTIHEQRSAINKVTLKQKFFSYKMSESDAIAQHISKVEAMAQSLSDVGEPVGDVDKIAKVLGSLPIKYGSFVTAWDSYDESKQTFENLTARLLKEEQRLCQVDEVSTAFAAIKVGNVTDSGQASSSKHYGNRKNISSKKNVECFYCHKKGHYKVECRKRLFKQDTGNKQTNHLALGAEIKNILTGDSEEVWLADSAASRHMTSRKEWFSILKPLENSEIAVQIGDNSFVNAEGIGSIKLMAFVNGRWEPRTMEEALYVPDLKKNLFSVGAATKKNFKATFDNNKIEIWNKGLVATGIKTDNQCYKMLFSMEKLEQANYASTDATLLWHQRLGHVNYETLKKMSDDELIPKLKLSATDKFFCESCQYGKLHRKPFSHGQGYVYKPGEFIHTDLCGKMPETSIGGSDYFIVFKDDCTSYRFVYFLKNKSDVSSVLKEFEQLVERQTGNKIRCIRSDNGTEYVNVYLNSYFKKRGIIHETSAPYTSEQNGKAEREIRSIVESARTMLLESGLPTSLWAEAVNTAVYALNRRPSKSNCIPYEKWFGRKCFIKHMKKFGCEAYVHTPKQFRNKFQSKSKKKIMVGYDNYSTNYRLYDPVIKKITVARDVVFNENASKYVAETGLNQAVYETSWLTEENEVELQPTTDEVVEHEEDIVEVIDHPQPGRNLRNREEICPPARFSEYIACAAIIDEPQTYKEAMFSKESTKWYEAMEEEISSLMQNNTWELAPLPPERQVIDCKWVYKVKRKPNGETIRFKARLCAKGYSQKSGIDYGETFSPVVRYESIRILLALAAVYDMDMKQFDVKTAFLYGELQEEIYIKQPEGFKSQDPNLVCKLKKSLYGLKQSPRCWNEKFVGFLKTFNLTQLHSDKCVFRTQINGQELFLAIFVDDGLILSKSTDAIEKVLAELKSQFEITIDEDPNYFVGMEITRNRENKEIFIHQKGYIDRLLKKFNMENCKPNATPSDCSSQLHLAQCPANEDERKEMVNIPFREAVGGLMYAATVSRPDITFAVSQVSRYLNNPGPKHWVAVKRILRYLQHSRKKGIKYGGNEVKLTMYSDADFAGDLDTRRSTTGYVSVLACGPVTWSSHRQKCVSRSTTEAEYVAASDATVEVIWLRTFLQELGISIEQPTILHVDNQSAIKLVKDSEHHKKTKHIDIRYHFIRDKVEDGSISVSYIPSEKQLADVFTKPLSRHKFTNNCESLNIMYCYKSIKQEWEC